MIRELNFELTGIIGKHIAGKSSWIFVVVNVLPVASLIPEVPEEDTCHRAITLYLCQVEKIVYASRAAFELYGFMFDQIWARYERYRSDGGQRSAVNDQPEAARTVELIA